MPYELDSTENLRAFEKYPTPSALLKHEPQNGRDYFQSLFEFAIELSISLHCTLRLKIIMGLEFRFVKVKVLGLCSNGMFEKRASAIS